MLKVYQIRTMAANEQITAALGIAVNIIPKDMDKIRILETIMRLFIELDERSRLAQHRERDSYHKGKLIKIT